MKHSYETASLKHGEKTVIIGVCECGLTRLLATGDTTASWVYVEDEKSEEECERPDEDEDLLKPIRGFGHHDKAEG